MCGWLIINEAGLLNSGRDVLFGTDLTHALTDDA